MARFTGKIVLVTGAGSGIGRATAERFASEGAQVACVDKNLLGAEETVSILRAAGAEGQARAIACDVSVPEQVRATVDAIVAEHGRLDVLCNVAGIGGFHRTTEVSFETWNKFIGVNLTGQFLMCQAAIPHILKSVGAIINVGSVAGVHSHPYSAAYCASKGGVVLMTKALAVASRRPSSATSSCPTASRKQRSRASCRSAAWASRTRSRAPSRSSHRTTRCT
jgi:NAD(P)-dependent dehydrogenase (short-subunit alcohol dehydrogenase family)